MTDDKKTKFDPNNPPKNMTPRQTALWLERGRAKLAREQSVEQLKVDTITRGQSAAEAKAAKVAAIRASSGSTATKISPGQVAAFLWMPQFKMSLQGFGFALSLLVQTFAQALIMVGLLPPDHPARTPNGAKSFGIFQLLEEARLSLIPIKVILDDFRANGISAIRILATRQYAVFSSIVAVLVTGSAAVLFALARVVFGSAHAFAQAPNQSGTGIGNFTLAPGDMGSSIIDGIFGTGTGSQSLVQSGLGTMFSMYSTMVLVFAAIIMLWIIISSVAETARTGIPFGKNFNHIWAPIRLIAALGLLIPLGSGLNSGQWVVLSLAKWGSQQATAVWGKFAEKMIAPANGQASSGVVAAPFDVSANRQFADNLFKVVLCQQVNIASSNNCIASGSDPSTCPPMVSQNTVGTIAVSPNNLNISANGTTPPTLPDNVPNTIKWYAVDSSGAPIKNGADCGGVTVALPGAAATASQQPADAAGQAILIAQSNAAASFAQNAAPLAQQLAQTAVSRGNLNLPSAYNQYQAVFNKYVQGYTATISNTIGTYNSSLTNGMVQTAQTYGWIYAPVWLAKIADQNGKIMDASQTVPNVTVPPAPYAPGDDTTQDAWTLANSYVGQWEPSNVSAHTSKQSQTFTTILNNLQQMTNSVGSNPLGQLGTYGRQLLTTGFKIIEPPDMIDCYQNPFSNPDVCRYVLTEAYMQAKKTGSWGDHKLDASQVAAMAAAGPVAGLSTYQANMGLTNETTFLPDEKSLPDTLQKIVSLAGEGTSAHSVLFPIGMIMISMGFTMVILTFIPLTRFILGVLNWLMMVFEAVLAVPLMSLSLLKTDGEGFATQQFQSSMVMLFGVIIRPMLMAIGLVIGLIAFNAIMQIANTLFAPTVANFGQSSDNSFLSLGVYMIFYGTLAYTLANSAFKAIDLLPNFVMGWIGQRMESRVDDATAVQQQASGFMQTMAYSSRGTPDATSAYGQHKAHQNAQTFGTTPGAGGGNASPGVSGGMAAQAGMQGPPAPSQWQMADAAVKSSESSWVGKSPSTTPAATGGTQAAQQPAKDPNSGKPIGA